MNINMSAFDLRVWAAQCESETRDPRTSGEERDRLLRMRDALLMLADNQDWLDGRAGADLRNAQMERAPRNAGRADGSQTPRI